MSIRSPTKADFSSNVTLTIVPPPPLTASSSAPAEPASVLILLHGLGDTHHSVASLANSMKLPETLCIAVCAPSAVPFSDRPGFHWGDDILFDPNDTGSGLDLITCGYRKALEIVLDEVIRNVLVSKCNCIYRDIVIMGLGQGGTVALAVADALNKAKEDDTAKTIELGGVISLGGAAPAEVKVPSRATASSSSSKKPKSKTPVLVCHGSSSRSAIISVRAREIKEAFEFVEFIKWSRPHDGMAENRDEMLPIMRFFGRRLRSKAGMVKGAVELG